MTEGKQVFKVLDYIDDKGDGQSLNFECNTPHVLILGNELSDIVALEKKMLNPLNPAWMKNSISVFGFIGNTMLRSTQIF